MKLTKQQLKQIIKEELERVLNEVNPDILTPKEIEDLLKLARSEDRVNPDILTPEEIEDLQYQNPGLRRAWRKALANWPRPDESPGEPSE